MNHKNTKKIGVVVPIYNTASFLKECLESLKNQSFKDIFVILVDDGSTDESAKIALSYVQEDERFMLLSKINGGLSSARNAGIEFFSGNLNFEFLAKEKQVYIFECKENDLAITKLFVNENSQTLTNLTFKTPSIDYLNFIDSDDFLELDTFEKCASKMQNIDVLWFNKALFYDKCDEIAHITAMEYYHYKEEQTISSSQWLKMSLKIGRNFFWYSYDGLINFEFLQKIKLKFINGIIHEDNIFGTLLFANAKKIYVYPRNFYHYRIRPNSIMNFSGLSLESSSALYLLKIYDAFEKLDEAKRYHKAYSWLESALSSDTFIKHNENKTQNKLLKECFLKTFCSWALDLKNCEADPLGIITKENLAFCKKNSRSFLNAFIFEKKKLKNDKYVTKIK